MTSLASVKGPSTLVSCPPESRTRVLTAVGASPPLATIVPALTASWPKDREPAHDFLRLCKGTIGHRQLPARVPHPRAKCGGQASLSRQQPTGLHALLD